MQNSPGTNYFAPYNEDVNIALTSEDFGNGHLAVFADCNGNPNVVALQPFVYAPGCQMLRTDLIGTDTVYQMTGPIEAPEWTLVGSGGGSSIVLQTNYVDNGAQALLNLVQGSGITINDDGTGNITFDVTAVGTIGGSIARGQIAFGTAADTIGGADDFTWDEPTRQFVISDHGNNFFSVDAGTFFTVSIGDVDRARNNTFWALDDNGQAIYEKAGNLTVQMDGLLDNFLTTISSTQGTYQVSDENGNRYEIIDPLDSNFAFGALDTGNGSQLQINDATPFTTLNGGTTYLTLDGLNNAANILVAGAFNVTDTNGNQFLQQTVLGDFFAGDVGNITGVGAYVSVSQSNNQILNTIGDGGSFVVQDRSGFSLLSFDEASLIFTFGYDNDTQLKIDDNTQLLSLTAGLTSLSLNGTTNDGSIMLDGEFSVKSTGGVKLLDLDFTNGDSTLGDAANVFGAAAISVSPNLKAIAYLGQAVELPILISSYGISTNTTFGDGIYDVRFSGGSGMGSILIDGPSYPVGAIIKIGDISNSASSSKTIIPDFGTDALIGDGVINEPGESKNFKKVSSVLWIVESSYSPQTGSTRQIQYVTPSSGATVTSDGSPKLIIGGGTDLAALTVVLPVLYTSGQVFGISSTVSIAALTLNGSGAGITPTASTRIASNGFINWVSAGSVNTWVVDSSGSAVINTITPTGTTGNRTINSLQGSVNIAAGGSTLTVTNNLVTANSVIVLTSFSDALMGGVDIGMQTIGSFTIEPRNSPVAETRVNFIIRNN